MTLVGRRRTNERERSEADQLRTDEEFSRVETTTIETTTFVPFVVGTNEASSKKKIAAVVVVIAPFGGCWLCVRDSFSCLLNPSEAKSTLIITFSHREEVSKVKAKMRLDSRNVSRHFSHVLIALSPKKVVFVVYK